MGLTLRELERALCAVHLCVAGEALSLAYAMGLDLRLMYDILSTSTGRNTMFNDGTPMLLSMNKEATRASDICLADIAKAMAVARKQQLPLPLFAVTEQVFQSGSKGDLPVAKAYDLPSLGSGPPPQHVKLPVGPTPQKVFFAGIGLMGCPMAVAVKKAGMKVVGFDVSAKSMENFRKEGGETVSDIRNGAKDADVMVIVVMNADQAKQCLFGNGGDGHGAAGSLPPGASIVCCSTVAPKASIEIQQKLDSLGKGLKLVDAPVVGGPKGAWNAKLGIFASGDKGALEKSARVLTAMSERLHVFYDGLGTGNKVKLINNLMGGVGHISAAEAFVFAKHQGMDMEEVKKVFATGPAYSQHLNDRIPRMFVEDPPMFSPMSTLTKDLMLILGEGAEVGIPLWLANTAQQTFVRASAEGYANDEDSVIWKLWRPAGVSLPE